MPMYSYKHALVHRCGPRHSQPQRPGREVRHGSEVAYACVLTVCKPWVALRKSMVCTVHGRDPYATAVLGVFT